MDYDLKKKIENEILSNFKRTSSWLLTKEDVEAIRKERGKERSSTADSFRRALSDPNLLEASRNLPEIIEDKTYCNGDKFGSLRMNGCQVHKKVSLDSSVNAQSTGMLISQRSRFSSTDSYHSDIEERLKNNSLSSSSTLQQEKDEVFQSLPSLTNRINEKEVEVQTEVTFINSYFYKKEAEQLNDNSVTTKF